MKKVILTILFAVFMIVAFATKSYATLVADPGEDAVGMWHNESLDRAYVYLRYVKAYTPGPDGGFSFQETNSANHFTFNTAYINGSNSSTTFIDETISNPDPSTYNYFKIHELSDGVETVVFDGIVDDLVLNTEGSPEERSFAFYDQDDRLLYRLDQGDSVKMYWYTVSVESAATIDDLPATLGNLVDSTDEPMGFLTIDNINTETRAVDFVVLYDEISYEITMFLEDISFLEEVHHGYYYTYDDQQFFYFSYSDIDLLIDGYDEEKGIDWEGFTVWNLTTDEVSQIRNIYVLTHFVEDENHDVYAYFYTPNVIMDELISVTVSFRYRFEKVFGGYTDWSYPDPLILEKDQTTASVTTWETALLGSAMASSIALASLAVLATPLIWPAVVIGGSAALIYAFLGPSITGIRTEDIAEIDRPTLSAAFVSLLESEWDVTIDSVNNSPHKLFLGQYQKAFTNGIDLEGLANDGDYSYTEVIYRRDTQQYVVPFSLLVTETPTLTASENLLPEDPLPEILGDAVKPFLVPGVSIVAAIGAGRQIMAGDFRKLTIIGILYVVALVVIATVI